jgi:hypothetical protein
MLPILIDRYLHRRFIPHYFCSDGFQLALNFVKNVFTISPCSVSFNLAKNAQTILGMTLTFIGKDMTLP